MDEPVFDAQELFGEDYRHLPAEALSGERSDAEAELLWRLLELRPGMEVADLAYRDAPTAASTTSRARCTRCPGLLASRLFGFTEPCSWLL